MSILQVLPKLLSRKWWLATLLVIVGVAVLIQLGFWQLDRLEQRRAFNQRVAERWQQAPFDITTSDVPEDLNELEYRRVQAEGEFDYSQQIVLTNQTRDAGPGVVVVTPLVFDNDRAVLVARGWVPYNQSAVEHWPEYEEPEGAPVIGLIQETQLLPNGNAPTPPESAQVEWYMLNIDAIQPQMPYQLEPYFILQLPEDGRAYDTLPVREEPLQLDEGNHFSYAIQWFMFALILGIGYVFFVRTQEMREQRIRAMQPDDSDTVLDAEPNSESDLPAISQQEGHA